MPADTLSREEIERINSMVEHDGIPNAAAITLLEYALSEPTRLAQARAEGVREGIERCAAEARRYASFYPPYSDGRNTFVTLADCFDRWAGALSPPSEPTGGMAEPVQTDDGWIEWKCGECPVPVGTLVEVRFRSGEVLVGLPGASLDWTHADVANGGGALSGWDIIAYRIVKPASAPVAPEEAFHDAVMAIGEAGRIGDLEDEVEDQVARIAALEAENAALRGIAQTLSDILAEDTKSDPDDALVSINIGRRVGVLPLAFFRRARALLQGGSDAG